MRGPLDEPDLDHNLRLHPMRPQTWQTNGLCERRFRNFHFVELLAEFEQQLRVEPGSDLSSEDKLVIFVMSNEQRAKTNTFPLWIGETTDYEILR